MKQQFNFLAIVITFGLSLYAHEKLPITAINLQNSGISEISDEQKFDVSFDAVDQSILSDLLVVNRVSNNNNIVYQHLHTLCELVTQSNATISVYLLKEALKEAAIGLIFAKDLSEADIIKIANNIEHCLQQIESGNIKISTMPEASLNMVDCAEVATTRAFKSKTVVGDFTIVGDSTTKGDENIDGNLTINGNETVKGNVSTEGNETIGGNLTVGGSIVSTGGSSPIFQGGIILTGNPQQACIIFQDSNGNEKARLCSSPLVGNNGVFVSVDGGITQNLQVGNSGSVTITPESTSTTAGLTVNGVSLTSPAILAIGNGTTAAPALRLLNNNVSSTNFILTIDASGNVKQSSSVPIVNGGQQPGPLVIGTLDGTPLTFITNNITRLQIDQTGNSTFTGNIKLPSATPGVSTANALGATQGLIELGGPNPSVNNVSMFEVSTGSGGGRNLFLGNYSNVPAVTTGADNIGIGINALSSITTETGNIAIGPFANTAPQGSHNSITIGINASAITSDEGIAIGNQATILNAPRSIVIGSTTGAGSPPIATGANAIVIGCADLFAGPNASGVASIAIGSANTTTLPGPQATADRSIALGLAPIAAGVDSIAVGTSAIAMSTNSIAIGSSTISTGSQSLAIGGGPSSPLISGAVATAGQAIAIGCSSGSALGAVSTGTGAIAIGSTSSGNVLLPGPLASNTSAIAIGSGVSNGGVGNVAQAGPAATGTFSIAIGTSTIATGSDCVAIGRGSQAAANLTIAIGSNDSTNAGLSPQATALNAIAIGSPVGANNGALASGESSIALGAANTTSNIPGALASGIRSIAIGTGASVAQSDTIVIGSLHTANVAAVKVGIGTNTPSAKLHIVGPAGTPVARFDAGDTTTSSQIVFTNVAAGSTAAVLNLSAATNGTLQVVGSSRRFKENFRPIDAWSSKLYQMNPCIFDYKQENGGDKDHTGFIAEEVAELFPSLVNYDADGKPFSNRDSCFHALAIREIQRHQKILDKEIKETKQHQDLINTLLQRIELLEAAIQVIQLN